MKSEFKKLSDEKLDKKTVIIRANLNLRLKDGEIDDDSKIKALIPTLTYLQKANCKTIILGHLGENCTKYTDELTLLPIRFAIGRALNKSIKFVNINNSQNSIKFMEFGDILLLENLCFSPEEWSKDKKIKTDFIKNIAQFADFYIDESFGVDQKLASTSILPSVLKPLLGMNYFDELNAIEVLKKAKKEGYVSLIGGEIKEGKLKSIKHLIKKSEKLLLGGEISLLFLATKGLKSENKKIKPDLIKESKELIKLAKDSNCEIILPEDFVTEKGKTIKSEKITKTDVIKDIGEKTIKNFQEIIETAKTLVVNGTLGVYEDEKFWKGTNDVFEIAALYSVKECYKVIGGEDTMEAIQMLKIKHKKFNHVTTGASEFIQSI